MYADYLVHFNKNHSSKNGQFTFGDGDGDGISDDHHNYKKNGWAVSRKLQNRDGSLTESGKYNLGQYKNYLKKEKIAENEVRKLLKSSKRLRDIADIDFDTWDDISDMAKDIGLNTTDLDKALSAFVNQDVKAIQTGSAMVKYMKDIKI